MSVTDPEQNPLVGAPESVLFRAISDRDEAAGASAHQIEAEMIDVHPPHHAISGWRDFFTHIATIVIGLLIAVGLEQSVEWMHHRSEVSEIRATLAHERQADARISAVLVEEYRRMTPQLETDRAVFLYLRDHPGAPKKDWPGEISWRSLTISYVSSAWTTAQTSGVLPLMPRDEVQHLTELYKRLGIGDDSYGEFSDAMDKAKRYSYIQPDPSKLSRAQIDTQLERISDLLAAHQRRGQAMASLSTRFSDFKAPTHDELIKINPDPGDPRENVQIRGFFNRIQAIKDDARDPVGE